VATMIGCLSTQALAFLAVFVYATHATQAIAFEWKPGFKDCFIKLHAAPNTVYVTCYLLSVIHLSFVDFILL